MVIPRTSTTNTSNNATMVNGRLVYHNNTSKTTHFSWLRFSVVVIITIYLHGTNYANFITNHHHTTTRRSNHTSKTKLNNISQQSRFVSIFSNNIVSWCYTIHSYTNLLSNHNQKIYHSLSSYERRRITNYVVFHIQEQTTKSIIHIGNMNIDCTYDDHEYPLIGISICQNIIQQYMTHHKPILYQPDDAPYTTHRCMAIIILLSSFISFCYTHPLIIHTGYTLIDSFMTMMFDHHTNQISIFPSFIHRLLALNCFIYPVLQAMDITIQQQSPDSIFIVSKTNGTMNFYCSFIIWILLAIIMNAASKSWTGQYILQFHSITAIGMGYYSRYYGNGMAPLWDWMLEPEEVEETWTFITWTIVIILAIRGSLTMAVFWCLSHCLGQMLYQYQYDHLVLIATARSLSNWIHSVSHTIQQMLFGQTQQQQQQYRHHKKY